MLKELSYFLAHPRLNDLPISLSLNKSILLIFKMIILYFGLAILTSLLFIPILKLLNLLPDTGLSLSKIPLSFKLIFFVPIYEEVIFRLPLKFSKQNLFLSLAALHFMLFYHSYSIIILSAISLIIASIPYFRLVPVEVYSKMGLIWNKFFPLLYYGLAISFGLIHMTNFPNLRMIHYLLFPLIVSNQIIMGLMFGYVRVTYKNGFFYSVLLHFFINLPLIWLTHL